MQRNVFPALLLVLAFYMTMMTPTLAVAYTGTGYSGTPIKYGGWLIGQVYMEVSYVFQVIPWATITVTSTDGTITKVVYSNGYGWYRVYLPPGDYKVTVTYAHYTQTYEVTIREDQIYRLLNIIIERPDMPEFQDHLASK